MLVTKSAPGFKAEAVMEDNTIKEISLSDYKGKKVVLFFYPLDFTFVCPTELHAFQEKLAEFEARDTQVVACSVDSWFSHAAWLNTPKAKGGTKQVTRKKSTTPKQDADLKKAADADAKSKGL